MGIKAKHHIHDDGSHVVFIEGLRVWLFQSYDYWVAQGLDIDFTTDGATQEEAIHSFLESLCKTILEHINHFGSLEKLVARRAPDEIYSAWIRELEMNKLSSRTMKLLVPQSQVPNSRSLATLPDRVKVYQPAFA
jgi:hypothetical protein